MKILLCVAGMPYAEDAASCGAIVAGVTQSPIMLLHVAHGEDDRENGKRVLAAAAEMLPDVMIETRIRVGEPVRQILAEVRDGDYDMMIMGARQGGGLRQQLLGSVAQKIVRRVPTSILVARRVGQSLERILICTGGKDVAEPVIEMGARLAQATAAQAILLHVTSAAPGMYTGLREIEETLPKLLQSNTSIARHLHRGSDVLEQRQVATEMRLRQGVAADQILSEAREGNYDLLIIGTSGAAGRLQEWLLGNVTKQIVENAPRSVLVVKQEQ